MDAMLTKTGQRFVIKVSMATCILERCSRNEL